MYNTAMKQMEETIILPPDILVAGHFDESDNYAVYRSRGSGNWLMTYTLDGKGCYRQPGVEVNATPDDLVLLRPGALHHYFVPPDGRWHFLWVHFQPRISWLSWWRLPEVGQGLFKIHIQAPQAQQRIRQTLFQLHDDASLQPPLAYTFLKDSTQNKQLSYELSSMLQRELALNSLEEILLISVREHVGMSQKQRDQRIQQVFELITHNLAALHTIDSLADAVALSPSRLAHLFKQEVGDSVVNTLLQLRLIQAARLLESTDYTICIIAEEVGFHSAFYFSRQFHQRFGMSPRDYRAATRLVDPGL